MISPYLDAILKLPVPDRLDLVEAIWDSLADAPEAEAALALAEQRAELHRRLAEHLADPGPTRRFRTSYWVGDHQALGVSVSAGRG